MLNFMGFGENIGIDLGTATVLLYIKGQGIVIREPSVVAIDRDTNTILSVGEEARRMLGRTPGNIVAIRPLREGVISNYEITEKMLKYFINKACPRSMFGPKPRVVVCVPSGVTEVEKRAVLEAAISAGAKDKDTYLIEEPMAASIGAGLPVEEPTGSMIVDIGGGTTEVAVISLGGVVVSNSIRVAGDELDQDIVNYVKKVYNTAIGETTAEEIKMEIGCALPPVTEITKEIRGRDLTTGLPKTITIYSSEMMEALTEPAMMIVDSVHSVLERTPPELASDIMEKGIVLAGGGALIQNLDKLLSLKTGMPVYIAENPLDCVVKGTEKTIEDLERLKSVLINSRRRR